MLPEANRSREGSQGRPTPDAAQHDGHASSRTLAFLGGGGGSWVETAFSAAGPRDGAQGSGPCHLPPLPPPPPPLRPPCSARVAASPAGRLQVPPVPGGGPPPALREGCGAHHLPHEAVGHRLCARQVQVLVRAGSWRVLPCALGSAARRGKGLCISLGPFCCPPDGKKASNMAARVALRQRGSASRRDAGMRRREGAWRSAAVPNERHWRAQAAGDSRIAASRS